MSLGVTLMFELRAKYIKKWLKVKHFTLKFYPFFFELLYNLRDMCCI